jgi:chromosome segregation ATPase
MSEETQVTNTEPSTNEVQTQDSQKPQFQIPTEAVDFVGDGKKYNSVEDALKSVPHAQKHIQTLESELATLKEELTKRKTAEELLDELKSGIQQPENTTQSVGIDQDKITELLNQTLESREKQAKAKANADSVARKFVEKYGDKAEEVYNRVAQESGLNAQQLNSLAASSPNIVLKLSGLEGSATPVGKPTSTVNTQALTGKADASTLSARVKPGATTKDLINAWKIAGEKVKSQL